MDKDEKEKEKEKEKKAVVGLGGLAGYGDSEDEEVAEDVDETAIPLSREPKTDEGKQHDDQVKEARRARAREWAEKRRHQNG